MGDWAKRALDVVGSAFGLVLLSPILILAAVAVWSGDRVSPLYVAPRVGRNGATFRMVKLRSMVPHASSYGWDSTRADDPRITRVGRIIRAYKLDELPQLWNVLKGDMSLVGPRPNVENETRLYDSFERRLLEVRPGITDFSSIVFADLAELLRGEVDPNVAYRDRVRPWKSRLGVFYVDHRSFWVDLGLIWLTLVSFLARPRAIVGVGRLLARLGADADILAQVEDRRLRPGAGGGRGAG